MLRDNLQPTDFADADCRVGPWVDFGHYGKTAYRIWVCRCTNFWFQRHEWAIEGKNSTEIEEWIFSGHSKTSNWFSPNMRPTTKDDHS